MNNVVNGGTTRYGAIVSCRMTCKLPLDGGVLDIYSEGIELWVCDDSAL